MDDAAEADLGVACRMERHNVCRHVLELRPVGSRLRSTGPLEGRLCPCACHDGCPLAGLGEVAEPDWRAECTCPGAQHAAELARRIRARSDQMKSQREEVLRGLDLTHRRTAAEIQADVLAAYAARGWDPPSDFSRLSRFVAAGTARRGTRSFHLLAETARGLRALRHWTPRPLPGGDLLDGLQWPEAQRDPDLVRRREELAAQRVAHNRAELRTMQRTLVVCGALTCASAVGAYVLGGPARGALIVVAVFFAALTAWMALWVFGVGVLTGAAWRSSTPPRG